MKKLFDQLSFQVSKSTTQKYSTSFSLGIKALHPKIRPAIYAIYAYVRLADEIVDSFHGFKQEQLLDEFCLQTKEALDNKISLNPILNAFQEIVHTYTINLELIDLFLNSMRMDLTKIQYDSDLYKEYILGSAEVVGLMCLQVFVEGDVNEYEKLKPYAMELGSAFQKINFLRDLKDDYQILGRTYFPGVDLTVFDDTLKATIEVEIEKEFKQALKGIKLLPTSSKFGVYLAYRYYWSLFKKIKAKSAQHILNERVRIHDAQKATIMMQSYFSYKFAIMT